MQQKRFDNVIFAKIGTLGCGKRSYFGIEHDFGRPIPPGGHVLGQESGVIVLGIGNARQTEVANLDSRKTRNRQRIRFDFRFVRIAKLTYLQIAGRVQQQVAGLQVAMQHVGRVNVFQAPQDLVQEVANVIVA